MPPRREACGIIELHEEGCSGSGGVIVAGKAIEKRPGEVDPRDEPSAEWGWHGSFPKATRCRWASLRAFSVS